MKSPMPNQEALSSHGTGVWKIQFSPMVCHWIHHKDIKRDSMHRSNWPTQNELHGVLLLLFVCCLLLLILVFFVLLIVYLCWLLF